MPASQWGGWGLLIFFLWYVYAHPAKVDKWTSKLERFLLWFGFKGDKRFITRDIRSKINLASQKMNKQAEGTITKGVSIVWVDEENIESSLREGKVIIRMKHYSNQDRNTVNAISHYVKAGVINMGKRYLPDTLQDAVNLSITKKILSEEGEGGTSCDYFSLNTLEPALKSSEELTRNFEITELMEEKGLFTRILLREIKVLGKRIHPLQPSGSVLHETKSFFEFLRPFASHIGGSDDIQEWQFVRNNIKMGIVYVAKSEVLGIEGIIPYKNRIEEKIRKGCQRIYIFGRGKYNIDAIEKLTKIIQKENAEIKIRNERYTDLRGERVAAICSVLTIE